ncbi:doublesex- and mab-3-related transcription factor B1-like [Sinocyclocheilus rhinocerous]|uniref:Doublesex- and mab-3-related transcription factor B1-like n=1 Tax=Sinocyclocheilus rhinocerous TaxID=307959 RepID=A0A673MZ95_9TELE|nr:PREDICTED: doublesex- and mab-3-related transcription factor B1-like [Sinocyclocheilus rhinocerous]
MANILEAAPNNRITAERAARSPKCARCRNHGFVVQLKGHSGRCQFKQCLCWKCSLINERTRILASQRRIRSVQGNESPGTVRPEQTALSGRKTVSAGNNKSTNRVNGDTDASARKESTINSPVDDTTYIELHAPSSTRGPLNLSAVYRDPKTPAGPSGTVGDAPPFPGECIIKEAVPGQMYPAEMFAMPLPLYQHYPDRYTFPAVLVTLRPPAPGAFREHVGFVPLPPGALSHPLEAHEWQIHVPHYSPYPPYAGMRDEHFQHSHSHMEGEPGRSELSPQVARVPESQVCGIQQTDAVPVDSLSSRNADENR